MVTERASCGTTKGLPCVAVPTIVAYRPYKRCTQRAAAGRVAERWNSLRGVGGRGGRHGARRSARGMEVGTGRGGRRGAWRSARGRGLSHLHDHGAARVPQPVQLADNAVRLLAAAQHPQPCGEEAMIDGRHVHGTPAARRRGVRHAGAAPCAGAKGGAPYAGREPPAGIQSVSTVRHS
jgi:hypothetical protein